MNLSTPSQPLEHPWDVTPQEAIAIQQRLRSQVICEDRFGATAARGRGGCGL